MSSAVETSAFTDANGLDKSTDCRPLDFARGDKKKDSETSGGKKGGFRVLASADL